MLDKNQHQIDVNLPGIVRSSSRNFISSHGSSDHAALSSLTTRSGDSPYFDGTKTNISRAPYLLFVASPRCQPIAASSSPFSIALSVAALDLTVTSPREEIGFRRLIHRRSPPTRYYCVHSSHAPTLRLRSSLSQPLRPQVKLHPLTAVASSALVPGHPRRRHLMPRSHCQVLACQPRARDQVWHAPSRPSLYPVPRLGYKLPSAASSTSSCCNLPTASIASPSSLHHTNLMGTIEGGIGRFGCQLAISQTCYDHPGLELPEGLNNKQPTDGKVAFIGSDGLDHHNESTPPMEEGKVEFREEAEGELLEEDIKTVDQEDVPLTLEGDANTEGANSVTIDPLTATPVELKDITIH
ncbi:hypothetical protein BHE74_00027815 [Ensete ventricosum]|nr:hypothetical protein BHE74_00027815 [Ensete ventricosum]